MRLVQDIISPVVPIVTTTAVSNITDSSATSGGNVTNDGGATISARGVCWSTSHNPTLSDSHTTNGTGTGRFTSSITGLTANTAYYVRAYATNSVGTSYGSEVTIITIEGDSSGIFSVGRNKKVRFSKGNLQWSATGGGSTATTHAVAGGETAAGTWRFAEHQWDIVGTANSNISSSYTGWIDLFGWGTSGYNNKHPSMSSTTSTSYGNGASGIGGTNYDWGVYNAISNGGNQPGLWRTLSENEWDTLLFRRSTVSGILFAKATVNGVQGVIIVPDNWSTSTYSLNVTNNRAANYSYNTISSAQWATLETAGCVFLPAAGERSGSTMYNVGYNGLYWSTKTSNSDQAAYFSFESNDLRTRGLYRYYGLSVRLVQDVTGN